MSHIAIVGGVYRERCIAPHWDQVFGSGGRAAAALSTHIDEVTLFSYSNKDTARLIQAVSKQYGFSIDLIEIDQAISFAYTHPLSVPVIKPPPTQIKYQQPIRVSGSAVLRFGMLEGTGIVEAERCVYDPQSAFSPEPFLQNGSNAKRLVVVGNRSEVCALGSHKKPLTAARAILQSGAESVIIKNGVEGTIVVNHNGHTIIPAFQSAHCWTIGSGDVFAAVFAVAWAVNRLNPVDSAVLASRSVAAYATSMALPVPKADDPILHKLNEAKFSGGCVYLASPFFTLSQIWLVEEIYRCLSELGMTVFSPLHDVGQGEALAVAPADLDGLDRCDAVFAILDGLDSGTLFEVGYARAKGLPVFALAQSVSSDDLKMFVGSGCHIFEDLVTALYHTVWRT